MRRHQGLMLAAAVLALTPTAAWAHADAHRGGGFVAGFLHPISGLDHVVAMVAVGLWGAVLGPAALWVLPLAWLLGGLIGLTLPSELLLALPCTALVAGSALAGHAGALVGLLGETVAIAVLTTLLTQLLAPPHLRWRAIGLRVGGSWITAASLLMLGWLVRHPP